MAPPKSGYRPPIIGSFEDIGKDIVWETASVPKDIAGKIIESLGGGSSGKKQQTTQTVTPVGEGQKEDGPLGTFNATNDEQTKRVIARAALEQLAGKHQAETSDTVHQEQQKEEMMKKEQQKQAAKVQSMELPRMTSKKRRGDLYGVKGKQSTELSKNVRQD